MNHRDLDPLQINRMLDQLDRLIAADTKREIDCEKCPYGCEDGVIYGVEKQTYGKTVKGRRTVSACPLHASGRR